MRRLLCQIGGAASTLKVFYDSQCAWLPIHPIGEKARKGVLGSPYAIRDYRAVNPEYGTLDDFRRMVDEAHRLGMRCVPDRRGRVNSESFL